MLEENTSDYSIAPVVPCSSASLQDVEFICELGMMSPMMSYGVTCAVLEYCYQVSIYLNKPYRCFYCLAYNVFRRLLLMYIMESCIRRYHVLMLCVIFIRF